MDYLPNDPAMLVSSVNMLLRDEEFDSLLSLCCYYDRNVDELKGESITITSESTWGRVHYEVLAADRVLEPYTKYLQFTEADESGKCYARAVMMVKEAEAEEASAVKFTFDMNGQSATVSSAKFYRAVSQHGEVLEPEEDHVFVAAVISGIPKEAAENLTISKIELV